MANKFYSGALPSPLEVCRSAHNKKQKRCESEEIELLKWEEQESGGLSIQCLLDADC